MKLDNLYIIESPLQALCALEVSLSLPEETHGIIIRLANTEERRRNDQQILDVINLRQWGYIHKIYCHRRGHTAITQLYYSYQLYKIKRIFSRQVKKLYIGEFRTNFMHLARVAIKAKQDCLLDDGTVTVEIVDRYLSKNIFYPFAVDSGVSLIKYLVLNYIFVRFYNIRYINRELKAFSVYSLKNYKNIEQIDFRNINKILMSKKNILTNTIYFYGSKYSEAGLLSLENEVDFLKRLKGHYHNKKIIYMAHRDESADKMDLLEKEVGMEVVIPEQMAELTLIKSSFLPEEIASACSSALVNVKKIFPQIKVTSFLLSKEQLIRKEAVDGIMLSYDYFKEINIPIVNLYQD